MNILSNKQYKDYNSISRYSVFPIYYNKVDDRYMYGTTGHLRDNTSYQTYTVCQGDTYDLMALEFYNNPTYYWAILDFNRIQDPFKEPEPGTVLKIPSLSAIQFED